MDDSRCDRLPTKRAMTGRRSMLAETAQGFFDTNDDELERKQRNQERVLELQRKNLSSPATPVNKRQSLGTGISGLTNAQLADHYANCMKLSAENKITVKNAFGLHLIDYMADMLKNRGGFSNFQVASCTLDASAKIYAYRVDCVHAETYKMAGGLGLSEEQRKSEKTISEEEKESNKRKIKKIKKSRTIEQNINAITLNKLELESEIDPLYQKMSVAFDEGGVNCFLFNTLCMNDNVQLPIDKDTPSEKPASTLQNTCIDIEEFKEGFNKILEETGSICPKFQDFSFLNTNNFLDEDEDPPEKRGAFAFDINAEPEPVDDFPDPCDNEVFDELMNDSTCSDSAVADNDDRNTIFRDKREDCAIYKINSVRAVRLETVHDLAQVLASKPSEYSYFDHNLLSSWAGPNYWKLRPAIKSKSCQEGNSCRKKAKKIPIRMNFLEDRSLIETSRKNMKQQILLSRSTLQNWNKEKFTLPPDLHFDAKKLILLSELPSISVCYSQKTSELDKTVGEYNYDNPNDQENFCPDVDSEGDNNDTYGDNDLDEAGDDQITSPDIFPTSLNNDGAFTGDNLVQQPFKVAKLDIHYARTAKKIDVKKLKQTMWHLLTSCAENKENIEDQDYCNMNGEMMFSDLYSVLPTRLNLTMAKNLSVPIAFVCFLHLVNEKNLSIKMQEDMADFQIMQG